MVTGALLGAMLRGALSFSLVYHAGWFWWFERGFKTLPTGGAGFTGFLDGDMLMSHRNDTGYCALAILFPALLGGLIGTVSGATGRIVLGSILGGLLSALAMLFMRLPELYRPGWQWRLWLDYNPPVIIEAAIVGAVVGGIAGLVGRILPGRKSEQSNASATIWKRTQDIRLQ
jgi:hypothetical protein